MAQLSHYLPRKFTAYENASENLFQIYTVGQAENRSVVHGDIAELMKFLMEYPKCIALRYHPRRIGFDGNKALVLAINRE